MKNAAPLLKVFGFLVIFFGLMFLLYAWGSQANYQKFLSEGKEAEGTIIEKWNERSGKSRYFYVRVSFSDKSIMEGGQLYFARAEVTGSLWEDLETNEKVTILYLPEDPEEEVVLKISTEPKNLAPIETYDFAYYTMGLGLLMFIIGFIVGKIQKRN